MLKENELNVNIDWSALRPQILPVAVSWHPYPKLKPLYPTHYLVTLKPKDWQLEALVSIAWWDGKKFSKEYGQSDYIVVAFQSLPAPYLIEMEVEE